MLRRSFAFVGLAAAIVACTLKTGATAGDGGTDTTAGAAGHLPCDVSRVLARQCQSCHGASPSYGAPMSLVTYGDLLAPTKSNAGKRVIDRAVERINDDGFPMPQAPNARLTTADRGVLEAWRNAGAPSAASACGSDAPSDDPVTSLSCTPDLDLRPAAGYELAQADTDRYVCYSFDAPTDAPKRWVTAVTAAVDNTTILHHALLYEVPAATKIGTTPAPCSPSGGADWRLVYGWAPGGKPLSLPDDVGFPMEPGTRYVVQLHLSNLNRLAGQKDGSGFSLCTSPAARTYDADVLAFGTMDIDVPARGTLDESCDLTLPAGLSPIHVLAAFPHMHQTGALIRTTHVDGANVVADLGGQDAWNFNNQPWVAVDATLKSGDTVRTRCVWKNPTDAPVHFGEKTSDEMCYSFSLYYPKITAPGFHWALPAAGSKCTKASPTP